jgi:hypothetical protein
MIFLLGLHVMIFNEGFVMLRHVSPIARQLREELIKDWGDTWQQVHSTLDWLWIVLVALGMYLDSGNRWNDVLLLVLFWGSALCLIYIPMWLKNDR